jgi:membrane-associated phospholipid phosphatase
MHMITSQTEKNIFDQFFEIGNASVWSETLVIFGAVYLIWLLIFLVTFWWWQLPRTKPSHDWPFFGKRKWLDFGIIALSVLLAFLINYGLGFLFMRDRPFVQYDILPLSDPGHIFGKSFPSDHTAVAFALSWVVFFLDRKKGTILLLLALLVGISRIMAGVHFPLDVLVGIFTGLLGTFIVYRIFKLFYTKKLIKN